MDVRYSARRLLSRPGYVVLAVLTLALGSGGLAAIISVARPLLFEPLPYQRESDEATLWAHLHDDPPTAAQIEAASADIDAAIAEAAAAVHADAEVVLAVELDDLERRGRDRPVEQAREVLLDRAPVDPGRAVARPQDHPRHRRLPLPGPLVLS
jgi:hypothetical protein